MKRYLNYQDMPKMIQNLVDGMEFLNHVERIKKNGKTVYKFVFRDSFEVWARYYDGHGNKVLETPFFSPLLEDMTE